MKNLHELDYYELLGVGADATAEDVLSAHRAHVRRLHPDRFSDLERPFTEHFDGLTALLNTARDTLVDPGLRARYDADLRRQRSGSAGGKPKGAASDDAPPRRERETDPRGSAGARNAGTRTGRRGGPASSGAGAHRRSPEEERELEQERAARERRERMVRGDGGWAARAAYAAPPAVLTAALAIGASWLYSVASFLLWQAGLPLAGLLLYLGLPLSCWRARSRWGPRTARVQWPNVVRRWPGFAPYNRRWLGRGLLEAGALGAPVGLAGALLPYASLLLDLASTAALGLGVLWVLALVGARCRDRASGDPGLG